MPYSLRFRKAATLAVGMEVREIRDIYDAYNFLTGKTLPRVQPMSEDELEPSPEMRKRLSAKALDWKARFQASLPGVARKFEETWRDSNEAQRKPLLTIKQNLQNAIDLSKKAEEHEQSGLFAQALSEHIQAFATLTPNRIFRAAVRAVIPEAIRAQLRPYRPDISPEGWEQEYRDGSWSYLHDTRELAHYSMIIGYYMHYRPGGSLVDVGCGEGILQRRLRAFGYARYLGIDSSQEAIARAQAGQNARTEFRCADAETFMPQGRWDVIVYNEILYYLKDPVDTVRRLSRVLNPGGISIVSMFRLTNSQRVWRSLEKSMRIADGVSMTHDDVGSWDVKVIRHL